jgi:hypothetical protein
MMDEAASQTTEQALSMRLEVGLGFVRCLGFHGLLGGCFANGVSVD